MQLPFLKTRKALKVNIDIITKDWFFIQYFVAFLT